MERADYFRSILEGSFRLAENEILKEESASHSWRGLSKDEIRLLEDGGNSSSNWSNVRIEGG
ncbi:MAG: hypothetical protein GF388_09880, partial [Candidatus Aegiribacteria sp.]|nr:hypothetical protein [Candidatus Aegiribacteria sp.]MBD3295341.1 hypothetical protein [Candidatus Fermentibacteria bacterium]